MSFPTRFGTRLLTIPAAAFRVAATLLGSVALTLLLTPAGALADTTPPQIHTVAGGGSCSASQTFSGGACDNVSATSSSIGTARSVSPLPGGGYLYVDEGDDLVREVQSNGKVITVAGTMQLNSQNQYVPDTTDTDGVPATQSGLDDPVAVAALANGGFLITEFSGARVRMVSPGAPGQATITTLAGIPPTASQSAPTPGSSCVPAPPSGSPCVGAQEELNYPSDAERTAAGGVLIADTYNNRILLLSSLDPSAQVQQIAGGGSCADAGTTSSCDGMQASQVALDLPDAVSEIPNGSGSYLFAEYGADAVRQVSQETATGTFATVAGEPGNPGFSGDGGPANRAQLSSPEGVTATPGGGFLIADSGNQVIRQVTASGTISTIAGSAGDPDYAGDNGSATAAALNNPTEAVLTVNGGILIADENNGAIREITQPPVSAISLLPSVPNGANGWYTVDPSLTVTSAEKVTSQCELDPVQAPPAYGAITSLCSALTAITPDGVHTLWVASQNSFGDQEAPVSVTVKVDATPPPITCTKAIAVIPYGSHAAVTATLSDPISGPASLALSAPADTRSMGIGIANVTGQNNAGKFNTVPCGYDIVARSFDPQPTVLTRPPGRHTVNVRSLEITNVPTWAKVDVTCRGRGCPFRRRSDVPTTAAPGKHSGLQVAVLGRLFAGAQLRAGTRISVSVVAPETVGRYLNLQLKSAGNAQLSAACLPVGALVPNGHSCKS